ncbi:MULTISPECIES: hypothetical protein [unclassified Microcoleus]
MQSIDPAGEGNSPKRTFRRQIRREVDGVVGIGKLDRQARR